jgi:hypothetical protein
VIEMSGETLKSAGISRRTESAAAIATEDGGVLADLRKGPNEIIRRKQAVLPIGHDIVLRKTVEIDGDVGIFAMEAFGKVSEAIAPRVAGHAVETPCCRERLPFSPPVNLETLCAKGASVAEQACGEGKFKITTPPDRGNCQKK